MSRGGASAALLCGMAWIKYAHPKYFSGQYAKYAYFSALREIVRRLPAPRRRERPAAAFTLGVFTGARDAEMAVESLVSVYRTWNSVPPIRIVSDGTLDVMEMSSRLSWWPEKLEVVGWTDVEDFHQRRGRAAIVDYGRAGIWGKKFGAEIFLAEHGPTLYSDSDVLWFKGPPTVPMDPGGRGKTMRMATDCEKSYDGKLLPFLPPLFEESSVVPKNAGVVFLAPGCFDVSGIELAIVKAKDSESGFSEQTLIAALCLAAGGDTWPASEIAVQVEDRALPLLPSYWPSFRGWTARHYVGPVRQLFWRDALALRIRLSKRFW